MLALRPVTASVRRYSERSLRYNGQKNMPLSLKGPLASVTMKLLRANDHLRGIRQVEAKFGAVACQVVFTEDRDKDLGYFVVHLPEPPLELSSMVGDCLHNLRATLDYLVWRMVMCNQ